jgi:MYXO-CTERM domain-containing protein
MSLNALSGLVALSLALGASLVSVTASANSGGVAGYTGKPNFSAPQGESCTTNCHGGGASPNVSITGPSSIAAGQSAEYSLIVATGSPRAAGAVAATDGVKLANVSGLADSFGELVQNAPMNVGGGQATFRFRVTAPLSGNSLRLWAVGLAAGGGVGSTGGDGAAQITRDITVTGGAPVVPGGDADAGPGNPGTSSGNASPGSSLGSGSKNTSSSGSSGSSGAANEGGGDSEDAPPGDDDGTGSGRKRSTPAAAGAACSASPVHTASGTMIAGFAAFAFMAAARRRRGP